jgi:hypothetical protein
MVDFRQTRNSSEHEAPPWVPSFVARSVPFGFVYRTRLDHLTPYLAGNQRCPLSNDEHGSRRCWRKELGRVWRRCESAPPSLSRRVIALTTTYLPIQPFLAGVSAYETITGIQSTGVIACAKHYIANEQEHFRGGSGATASSSNVNDRTMHEVYMWPFAESVRAGVGSVMCAYNR